MNHRPTPLADLSEKQFDHLLFQGTKSLAKTLGWESWHVVHAKGSRAGLPDRICWRERVLYTELKSTTGKPTPVQVETLTGLAKAGAECYLWTPADWDELTKVLGGRWMFNRQGLGLMRLQSGLCDVWQPKSLWLQEGHRADHTEREPELASQLQIAS